MFHPNRESKMAATAFDCLRHLAVDEVVRMAPFK